MRQYIVDAFTNKPFSGNPAAVCVMERWPSEEFMMSLARENNLSETAFIVREDGGYLHCELSGNGRILISGEAVLVAVSDIVVIEEEKTC